MGIVSSWTYIYTCRKVAYNSHMMSACNVISLAEFYFIYHFIDRLDFIIYVFMKRMH